MNATSSTCSAAAVARFASKVNCNFTAWSSTRCWACSSHEAVQCWFVTTHMQRPILSSTAPYGVTPVKVLRGCHKADYWGGIGYSPTACNLLADGRLLYQAGPQIMWIATSEGCMPSTRLSCGPYTMQLHAPACHIQAQVQLVLTWH